MFSIYTNLLIPGNTIKLHVDTPDFAGLDRSRCPSWLLAAAHCSGLLTEDRIRNVTCVCYPRDANGGELSLHAANKTGCVFPVRRGTAVVMNADSIFHQVAIVKPCETAQVCQRSTEFFSVSLKDIVRLPPPPSQTKICQPNVTWRSRSEMTGSGGSSKTRLLERWPLKCERTISGSASPASFMSSTTRQRRRE